VVYKTFYIYRTTSIVSENNITVFPNPFKDFLYIGLPEESEFELFELYDLKGRRIMASREHITDLSFLARGLYIIRVMDKNGNPIETVKVIRE
jgi:hypothetical protein